MIALIQNDLRYDYDIRTLLQAFFDNEKVVTNEEGTRLVLRVDFRDAGTHTVVLRDDEGHCHSGEFTGDYRNREQLRNTVKEAVYGVLSAYTGRALPWGTLTGIRPVKLVTRMLSQGMTPQQAQEAFQSIYHTTPQKAQLSVQVALRERQLLNRLDVKDAYSLYIGIPFCPSTCLYCSFTSYPVGQYRERVDEYLDALFREMEYVGRVMGVRRLSSIYIGGGTPTALSPEQLERLLQRIQDTFCLSSLLEFTVEAGRPDSITGEKLQVLKDSPVTRISINPQTMQEQTLKRIGRSHTAEQFRQAYALARKMGFSNINMDLIMGLPGETFLDVCATLQEVKDLRPDSLTVHSLAIKRAANLNIRRQEYAGIFRGATDEMLQRAYETAQAMELHPYYLYRQKNIPGNYENTGYAAAGKECLYNILIMEEVQTILALGAGAASKYVFFDEGRVERTENVKNVDQYIERIDEMIERKRGMLESVRR